MKTYENFAGVYDELMDNVPYRVWADFLEKILKDDHIQNGLMLDLGCGTGKMTALMAKKGYDMIGVDSSMDMLQIARERTQDFPESFLYLLQDMRAFELYGTVQSVISVCDSVNYITKPEDLEQVFRLVNNYLDPGGIFIFDFNTEYKYQKVIGDRVIAEDREDVSFIWYNEYDVREHLNYIDLSIFVQEKDNLFRKFQEQHVQRGYTVEQMKTLVEKAGLVFLEAFDDYTEKMPHEKSERVVFVVRENGKLLEKNEQKEER